MKKWNLNGELLEKHVLPEVNPFDPDYPSWGTNDRSLNLLKTKDDTYMVFTEGYACQGNNVEFYIESIDEIDDFDSSWQKNLIYETCRNIIYIDDLDEVLKETEFLVLQLHMEGAPKEWSYDHKGGNIGLFIGLERKNEDISEFDDNFKFLNVKLMRPSELKYAIEKGIEGRKDLAKLYAKEEKPNISSMLRNSVI